MSIEQDIQEIEITIEEAQKAVALNKAVTRLKNNKDFKEVIEQHYFIDEAARAVAGKSNPNMQDEYQQKELDNIMIGIGNLQQYFNKLRFFAEQAEASLGEHEETRQELLEEQISG